MILMPSIPGHKNPDLGMEPELSVIIPFRGEPADLSACLEGLRRQRAAFPFEIIVAESGKSPEVKCLVDSLPNTVLISSSSVMFPGKARNQGADRSRSGRLAFIDADCVPPPNWASVVLGALNDGNDIVCGPVLDLHPFHPLASVDNLLQFVDFQKYRPPGGLTHFPACNLGISKRTFRAAGGFPEDLEVGEDVRFSEAVVNQRGGPVRFDRAMTVRHRGRRGWAQFLKHQETFGYYRARYNLRISVSRNAGRGRYGYALYLGLRRLAYLVVRTIQWNPAGLVRIAVYFPVLIAGLLSWANGFHSGSKKIGRAA
jgi:glycosyltransferase involved in cell wall biosynthesis